MNCRRCAKYLYSRDGSCDERREKRPYWARYVKRLCPEHQRLLDTLALGDKLDCEECRALVRAQVAEVVGRRKPERPKPPPWQYEMMGRFQQYREDYWRDALLRWRASCAGHALTNRAGPDYRGRLCACGAAVEDWIEHVGAALGEYPTEG